MNNGMSPQEFQNYLGLLSRLLRLKAAQREALEAELRVHLEERFAALTSEGIGPQRAVSMALAEFGDAAALAAEFSAVSRLRKRRWMMRFTFASMAAGLLLIAVVASLWPDGSGELASRTAQAQQVDKPAAAKAKKQDPNAETLTKLEALAAADFHETPLKDVLDYLAEVARVQTYVDRKSLDEIGVQTDAPITIELENVPVEMLLRLVLGQLDLGYTLDHGVVIVATQEEVEATLDVRVYRIDDLVGSPSGEAAAESDDSPGLAEPSLGGGGRSAGRSRGDVEDLMDLITSTVQPDSWDVVGGPATISQYRGTLVISQTFSGHRDVEKLLKGLREALAK